MRNIIRINYTKGTFIMGKILDEIGIGVLTGDKVTQLYDIAKKGGSQSLQ